MRRLDLSISQRLLLGFGVVLALIGAQAVFLHVQYDRIEQLEADRTETIAPARELAYTLHSSLLKRGIALRNLILTGEERYERDLDSEVLAWNEGLLRAELLRNGIDPTTIATLRSQGDRYDRSVNDFVALMKSQPSPEVVTQREAALSGTRDAILQQLSTLMDLQTKRDTIATRDIDAARSDARNTLISFSILLLVSAVITGWLTARSVQQPAAKLLEASRALHRGDFTPALALRRLESDGATPRSELVELSHSFGSTAAELKRRQHRTNAHAALSSALASHESADAVSRAALEHIVSFTGAELGAVFVRSKDGTVLTRIASHGADSVVTSARSGEGIVGQAATSRERIVVRDIPPDLPWKIHLGGPPLSPRTVVATPLVVERSVIGVLLLASLRDLGDDALSFANDAGAQLAVSLANALAADRVRAMADELSRQNEALQAQSEEIQAQNEELQAQSEEIQAQNEELQAQSEELQSQNHELEIQKSELSELDRLKDEFLSIASHELRTPITTMKLFVSKVLRRAPQHPEWNDVIPSLQGIDRQANRLSELITRLLDTSRASMKRLEVKPVPVDLCDLLRSAAVVAQTRTTRHNIHSHGLDGEVNGEWDRGYIEQVVVNLFENAIRYSPEGGDITLSMHATDAHVTFSVRDSGIGIPEDDQVNLFRPYFRHEEAKQVSSDGLGIGLFLSHEIISAHGGRMLVQSTRGQGSTFTVELPRHCVRAERILEASA